MIDLPWRPRSLRFRQNPFGAKCRFMRLHRLTLLLLGLLTCFNALAAELEKSEPRTNRVAIKIVGLPAAIDLRPQFEKFELAPRRQLSRPTCSAFTVAGALEFAAAKRQGHGTRLSVEFLNWSANKVCGDREDGGFFSDLWKGFMAYGLCAEQDLPYAARQISLSVNSMTPGRARCGPQSKRPMPPPMPTSSDSGPDCWASSRSLPVN